MSILWELSLVGVPKLATLCRVCVCEEHLCSCGLGIVVIQLGERPSLSSLWFSWVCIIHWECVVLLVLPDFVWWKASSASTQSPSLCLADMVIAFEFLWFMQCLCLFWYWNRVSSMISLCFHGYNCGVWFVDKVTLLASMQKTLILYGAMILWVDIC